MVGKKDCLRYRAAAAACLPYSTRETIYSRYSAYKYEVTRVIIRTSLLRAFLRRTLDFVLVWSFFFKRILLFTYRKRP